jgi:hypothetical protein
MNAVIHHRFFTRVLIAATCATVAAGELFAVTSFVDWQKGIAVSSGEQRMVISESGHPIDSDGQAITINQGRADAAVRARENALLHLVTALRTVHITPDSTFDDLLASGGSVQERLNHTISTAVFYREYPRSFDVAACDATLPLNKLITSLDMSYPELEFPLPLYMPIATDYSSLVIDCRGLDIMPMVFPSIFNEDGLEIYGPSYIKSTYAEKFGIVSYAHNEEEARRHIKYGSRPYYTVALKSVKRSPVLSYRDINKIFASPVTREELKKCKVIMIIDRKK